MRPGEAWKGVARKGKARFGTVGSGVARLGTAWSGLARFGSVCFCAGVVANNFETRYGLAR